jgi:hypothetical protein
MKPILFNTEMVRATLGGRKTTTRRIVKRKGYNDKIHDPINDFAQNFSDNLWEFGQRWENRISPQHAVGVRSPYQPGDILYVRETWRETGVLSQPYAYRATESDLNLVGESSNTLTARYKYRPSIHMPKEAARIFLRVTDVKAERLQGITEEQAIQEGCINSVGGVENCRASAKHHFCKVWDSTVKKSDRDKYGWAANPWVWVISFERFELSKEDI